MVFKKLFKILKRAFANKKRRHKAKPKARHKAKPRPKPRAKHRPKTRRKPKPKSKSKSKPKIIGVITHYFPKVNAAVVKLKRPLKIGEPIWIKGKLTDFRQTAGSMQIDRKPIEAARAGQEIGLQVFREVRPGDCIFVSAKQG
jgi:hypothetical protein